MLVNLTGTESDIWDCSALVTGRGRSSWKPADSGHWLIDRNISPCGVNMWMFWQLPGVTTCSCVNVKYGDDKERASQASLKFNLIREACPFFHEAGRGSKWQAQSLSSPASPDQKSKPFSSQLQTISQSVCLRLTHVDTTQARCNGIDLYRQSAPVSWIDTSIISSELDRCCTNCKLSRL